MATQQSEKIFVHITKECIRSKPIRIKNDVDKKYKNNLCAVYLPSIGQEDMALSILMAKKYYMNQPTRIPSLKQLALTKVVDTCNEHDFPKTNILCVPVVTKGKNKNAYNVIGSSYTITMSGKDVIELINEIKNGELYTISNEVSIMKGGKEKRNYKVIA